MEWPETDVFHSLRSFESLIIVLSKNQDKNAQVMGHFLVSMSFRSVPVLL